jgi:hypothetical protein
MKLFFTKVVRFFWSWGFLKFILWTVTLIIFFYVEEDWRGARAWAATKAKWEAQSESLDYYGKFIPPLIPDPENLAAIPLFKMEPDPQRGNELESFNLERAMRANRFFGSDTDLPPLGVHWQIGEVIDPEKLQLAVLNEFAAAFKGTQPPQNPIAQFEALFPFLSELRAASASHPYFRLSLDYSVIPPDGRALGPLTQTIRLSKILTLHALLALEDQQSDLALEDLKVNFKIAAGIKRDPTVAGGLVGVGITNIGMGAVFDGLVRHQWSDANLVELDQRLKAINFLSDGQFAMRSAAAASVADIEYYSHSRLNTYALLEGLADDGSTDHAPTWMVRLCPPHGRAAGGPRINPRWPTQF